MRTCSVQDCEREYKAKGYCYIHYRRNLRHGTADLPSVEERIEENTLLIPESTCHWWIGSLLPTGYGRMYSNGKTTRAHRLVYELHHGEIPQDMVVCHSCDNPSCVNIDHLWLGTPKENCLDMHAKGRANTCKGSNLPQSRLTESDVVKIREMKGELQQKEIAHIFGIAPSSISLIINGHRWKHVM